MPMENPFTAYGKGHPFPAGLQTGFPQRRVHGSLRTLHNTCCRENPSYPTDEWQDRGVKQGAEYAILTDELTRAWSGMTTKQYKRLKGLKKENLRDNMSTTEIILNMLAETSTKDISKKESQRVLARA